MMVDWLSSFCPQIRPENQDRFHMLIRFKDTVILANFADGQRTNERMNEWMNEWMEGNNVTFLKIPLVKKLSDEIIRDNGLKYI